jgi:hypothetical protein
MKNLIDLCEKYKGLRGGWYAYPANAGFNFTIGKPIPFLNQLLFPNYKIKQELKPSSDLTLIQFSLDSFIPSFPKPPDVYYSTESAVLQNAGGFKVLSVLLKDITHPPNAVTNLYYFGRTSEKEIKILDATKLTEVGVLTKTIQKENGETIELTNQYYGALYGIAYTPDKKPVPTITQFIINTSAGGRIKSIQFGYALPIYLESYSAQVTRSSFTVSNETWIGENINSILDESFTNPFLVNINYIPNAIAYTCKK